MDFSVRNKEELKVNDIVEVTLSMFQEEIFKTLGKVSIGSLYRWRALLDYNKDWTALVGQYKYSTRKEYRTTLNEEQIKIFIQIFLSPSAFSIGKAISLLREILDYMSEIKPYCNRVLDVVISSTSSGKTWTSTSELLKLLRIKVTSILSYL